MLEECFGFCAKNDSVNALRQVARVACASSTYGRGDICLLRPGHWFANHVEINDQHFLQGHICAASQQPFNSEVKIN